MQSSLDCTLPDHTALANLFVPQNTTTKHDEPEISSVQEITTAQDSVECLWKVVYIFNTQEFINNSRPEN